MTNLEKLAVMVALETPLRRSRYSPSAYVSWDLIEQIRDECEKLGIDWRALNKRTRAITEERRKHDC